MRKGTGIGLAALCCLGAGLPAPAPAQQSQGGLSAQFTYSEQLVAEDTGDNLRSDLGFFLSTATRAQRFEFDIGAGLEKRFSDGRLEGDIVDPRLRLFYGLENRNTALSFDASYREVEISQLVLENSFLDDPTLVVDEPTLVLDEGTRASASVALGLEFGRAAPFGGTVSLRHAETRYSDTQSTGLLDSEQESAELRLRFDINPLVTGRTVLSVTDLDRDGGVDTRTEQMGVGASMAFNKTLTGEFDIGTTRVEEGGSVPRSVRDGTFYSIGLVQDRPNGSLSGSLNSNIDENGRRTTLRVDRVLELPEAQLRFGLGASRDEDTGSTDPLYSVSYNQNLPRGSFSAGLEQSFGTDTQGDETLDTRLRLALSHELTPVSSLSARFSVRDTATGSAFTTDTRQVNVGLDYSHALNRDWALVAGFSHTRQDRADGTRDTDDRLYLGLRLTEIWQP